MSSKKSTGSYYTPELVSTFIFDYLSKDFLKARNVSFLEPSVGDGSFIKSLLSSKFIQSKKKIQVTCIELVESELLKVKDSVLLNPNKNVEYNFICDDFLNSHGRLGKFKLIAGNPPYISKKLLTLPQIDSIQQIHKEASLSPNSIKNLWTAFILKGCQLLTSDGVLAYVLPSEILQVSFAVEIRLYLSKVFERIEIFTFSELLFECKGQDTILLIGYKKHTTKGHFFTHIDDITNLHKQDFELKENEALSTNDAKWSHHTIDSDSLNFAFQYSALARPISFYCNSKPGIVTAANNFFIVDKNTEDLYSLKNYTRPIIQKGIFVNGSVVFNQNDFEMLVENGKPSKLLVLNEKNSLELDDGLMDYLKIGETREINKRYKCKLRTNWFQIPNIAEVPEGFFFKRSHGYPKLLKNEANALVTDSAYKIAMKGGYNLNSFIFSFYNSLTLLFAELEGRYYGGGVLELIPSEFNKLPIPYMDTSEQLFNEFVEKFEKKQSIKDILIENDRVLLGQNLNLDQETIVTIQNLYNRLINKRLRK